MELLWDFALTLAVSLLLPSIFIKLLSVLHSDDEYDGVDMKSRDCGVESDGDIQNWETEEVVLVSGKFDDLRGESILERLLEANCGSPKISNGKKIDENVVFSEIEVVDESNQRIKISEVDEKLEISKPVCEGNCNEIDECDENEVDYENKEWLEEDDWEGIESSELERIFGSAVLFVESKTNAERIANLSNDVKMKLYGFHKIATQGPCHKPQPMALNFTARAKWYFNSTVCLFHFFTLAMNYIIFVSNVD